MFLHNDNRKKEDRQLPKGQQSRVLILIMNTSQVLFQHTKPFLLLLIFSWRSTDTLLLPAASRPARNWLIHWRSRLLLLLLLLLLYRLATRPTSGPLLLLLLLFLLLSILLLLLLLICISVITAFPPASPRILFCSSYLTLNRLIIRVGNLISIGIVPFLFPLLMVLMIKGSIGAEVIV